MAAVVTEQGWESFKAPLRRVTGPDIPVPANSLQELYFMSDEEQLVAVVMEIL